MWKVEGGMWKVEGKVIHFKAESDALIVKGIVSLLIRVLSDIRHRRSSTQSFTSSTKSD